MKNNAKTKRNVKLRPYACDILELFEDVLDKHNITIPDEDDDQKEPGNNVRIYGMTSARLEDDIAAVLYEFAEEISNKEVEIVDSF